MPVAYGMERIVSDSESNRLEIASDEDYSLPSKFFISDSDGSRAQTSDGPVLDEPSGSGWDSDILENIHDRAIARAFLNDPMCQDMAVNMDIRKKGPLGDVLILTAAVVCVSYAYITMCEFLQNRGLV